MGLKREGEASFPFLCFWFLLSQYKRNGSSFPFPRGIFFLPLGRDAGFFLLTISRETAVLFSKAKWYFAQQSTRTQKCFLRVALRSVRGEAGNPALLSRLFPADCLSVPACTTTVLLQVLQGLAVTIHLAQSLYGLPLSLS